jgi:hypothetical protein
MGEGLIPNPPKMYPPEGPPTKLSANDWTLFDKVTYGGLGYGAFVLPSNFFIIIVTCIFPPLGQIINILGNSIISTPPFFTLECLKLMLLPKNFTKIINSVLLTSLFYIPGLVYVLGNIVDDDNYAIASTLYPSGPTTTKPSNK